LSPTEWMTSLRSKSPLATLATLIAVYQNDIITGLKS
jgi:hypothetical protein